MKRFLVVLLVAASAAANAQNPGDDIFAGIQVHTVNLRFAQPQYWDSLTTYYNEGKERYIVAQAVLDGVVYDSIGVRLKGNSSYSHPNNKKSFRLSFDEYKDGQRWDGLKGVHLNNCWGDPTFMREKIHLDFCRAAGIAAPRANYARLFINDTLFAFYSLVEHVDKRFLGSRYGDNTGDLFKAVDDFGSGSNPLVSDFRWLGSDTSLYFSRYEFKTDESTTGWEKLVVFLDTLNNSASPAVSLPKKANLPTLYKAMAADNLFGNLDAYLNSGRNFYFYFHPVNGKLEWIVWDTGLSFGAYTGGVANIQNLSVTYVNNAANRPLLGKIINEATLKSDYLRAYCAVYNEYFSAARWFPHIDSVANLIRPYVNEDPRKMYTLQQFETNIVSNINASGGGGTLKPGLKSFITARQTNVASQLAALGVTCAANVKADEVVINEFMALNDSIRDPAGEADDWIELYNNTANAIKLDGMYLSDDRTQPKKWQFPANTTIAANGYLIVWADEDSAQTGLHANFQLSASGEHLRLSNADGSVVDSVSFGAQIANRSRARIPNGTGPFVLAKATFNANNGDSAITETALTTIILPQVIEGLNGTNTNRIPFVYRGRLSGLLANATYRFTNQIVTSADAATTSGAGNCIFASSTGNFVRTSGPSLATAGAHGTFTTDANGDYEGWFINEPTGNARFVPGNFIFMRIALNDGGVGTAVALRLTTKDSVRVVKLDTLANNTAGTGLRCTSGASAKDLVFAYDNTAGTGRPISGSFVESDGTDNTTANSYAAFYASNVNGVNGAFGMVVPNALPNGIRRIERRSLTSGAVVATATDADGIWPSGASTVNPLGGTKEIVLSGTDVSLATSVRQTESANLPTQFALSQNHPNPFNPTTTINFQLPSASHVQLKVFDVLGREVATLVNEMKAGGSYSVSFNAAPFNSGIYFYKIAAGEFSKTLRMVLTK
jgi:hypothetical protein